MVLTQLGASVTASDGTIIDTPSVSPVEWKKMQDLYNHGVPVSRIMNEIHTTTGDTLASAIDKFNKMLSEHGGAASPHFPTHLDGDMLIKMFGVNSSNVPVIEDNSTNYASPSSEAKVNNGVDQTDIQGGTLGFLIIMLFFFFMMWLSSPSIPIDTSSTKVKYHSIGVK